MKNLALFSSSKGSTFDFIYNKTLHEPLINTAAFITNNSQCGALKKAKGYNCKSFVFDPKNYSTISLWDEAVIAELKPLNIDLIVLAGYLQKIGDQLISQYQIINTHPSLLPKYGGKGMYGKKIHQKVFQNKERETGATIHYVSSDYDEGQIIDQKIVKLTDQDTVPSIEDKVKIIEKELLWTSIQNILLGQ